jgi:hypothetical protein
MMPGLLPQSIFVYDSGTLPVALTKVNIDTVWGMIEKMGWQNLLIPHAS